MNDPDVIEEMLHTARTIAVVGMSNKSWRASYNIGKYPVSYTHLTLPTKA